ncbi:hypothetical protein BDZ94DRAFT_1311874 [Collybia nuda]|uniref:DUF6534 domain-containing protein n=1 Tax=Collybia nuda TaxID=64659 RepID=A0A9P5Y2F7_9AGAR|nr:hypothetical protein BDZ94DRAFT_1311874 [Collybia nuda]
MPIPTDIEKSTAPLLLGYILNWGLYGSLCVQVYYYYLAFPKDRLVLKGLVYGLCLMETAQSILIAHDLFKIFAFGYGNVAELIDPQLTWVIAPIMTGIGNFTVQAYFAHRIHIISGSKIPGIIILMLALMQSISAVVCGVQVQLANDFTAIQDEAPTTTTIWLVGSAVCDIIIALFMIYFLSRRATGFSDTQAMITKIMRLTVETGSLTATVAIIDVVLFIAFKSRNYHVAPALILGKLYSNTLVTSLNSRLVIVGSRNSTSTDEINSYRSRGTIIDSAQRMRFPGVASRLRKGDTSVTVNIERQVWNNDIPMDRLDGHDSSAESTRGKVRVMEDLA